MKKLLTLLLAVALTASMVACTNNGAESSNTSSEESSTSSQESSQEESSKEESSEEESSESLDVETPDADNVIDEIYNEVIDAVYGDIAEDVKMALAEMDESILADMVGVDPTHVANFKSVAPMMSATIDTVIIIEATEGNVEAVQAVLEQYRDNKIMSLDPAQGGMSYPGQLEQAKSAQVVVSGNYVAYYLVGTADGLETEAEILEKYTADVQIAVDKTLEILG